MGAATVKRAGTSRKAPVTATTSLTAEDLMSRDVITVRLDTALRELATILHENRISGVPVVDDLGTLVGVVSESDLVRHKARDTGNAENVHDFFKHSDPHDRALLSKGFVLEDLGDDPVSVIYTPYLIKAGPKATLADLSSLMVHNRVHRVLIVDGKRLMGIVSSLDVLRSLIPNRVSSVRRYQVRA